MLSSFVSSINDHYHNHVKERVVDISVDMRQIGGSAEVEASDQTTHVAQG